MEDRVRKHLPIDRGWAWVTCVASLVLYGFITSVDKCQGLILVELQEKFSDTTTAALLWLFSLRSITNFASGLLTSYLLSRLTHRTVAVTGVVIYAITIISNGFAPQIVYVYVFIIINGVSTSMVFIPAFTSYTAYFDKKKALAVGIVTSGGGFGTICVPPLLRLLFDNFSFSSAMLLFGGLVLQLLVVATLLRPISFYENLAELKLKEDSKLQENQLSVVSSGEHLRRRSVPTSSHFLSGSLVAGSTVLYHSSHMNMASVYSVINEPSAPENSQPQNKFNWKLALKMPCILSGLAVLCFISGFFLCYQCLPSLANSAGVSKETVALTMSVTGVVEIPSKLVNGLLADRKVMSGILQLTLCMCISAVATLLCAVFSGVAGIVILLVALSVFGGAVFSLMPIASGELLGQENVTTAIGFNMVYQTLAIIISAFSAGSIYERFGRWEYVFYFIAAAMLGGSVFNGINAAWYFRKQRQDRATPTT